jgi:hypothetical protein
LQENELPLDKDLIWLNGVGSITPTAEIQCETFKLSKSVNIAKQVIGSDTVFTPVTYSEIHLTN